MNLPAVETINDLNDTDILGYYESLRGNFCYKCGMVVGLSADNLLGSIFHQTLSSFIEEFNSQSFNTPIVVEAFEQKNPETIENLKEDAVTALVVGSWSCFEQIIKDLPNPNYAEDPNSQNADFYRQIFGFSQQEKNEIEFFYHLRNAIVHYNGAYHAYKKVDLLYHGSPFKSDGQIGEKIIVSPKLAYEISIDLEKYAMKAWSNVKGE